jgi:hypothetical protein
MTIPSDFTPASIQTWVDELPYANKPLVAKEVFEVIQRLPEYELPPRHQISILESIEYPVGLVLDHVGAQLIAGHTRTEQFLSLGEAYCEKLIGICETLAENCCKKGGLRITDRLPRRGLALVNHFFEQWHLLRAVDHRPAPEGLWRRIKEINAHAGPKKNTSMARLIAFHLASPQRMNSRQMYDVAALLKTLPLEKLVSIDKKRAKAGQVGFFLPPGDCPPEFGAIPSSGIRVDLSRLVTHLRSNSTANVEESLLNSLLDRWSGSFQEKQRRTPTSRPLHTNAVIGLRSIARHLRQLNPVFGQQQDELPQTSFVQEANPFAAQTETTDVSFLDLSEGGCRIRTNWQGVTTGDLISVFWGRVEWRIGTIVWMLKDGQESECGVQWLLKKPQAVSLRFDVGEPVPGIRGNCLLDGHEALLYCAQKERKAESCLVKSDQLWESYQLSLSKSTGLVELARAVHTEQVPTLNPVEQAVDDEDNHYGMEIAWDALSPFPGTANAS